MSPELCKFKLYERIFISLSCLSSLLLPLSFSPRGLVFCRWARRLAPSILQGSLQQNQYLRTICAVMLPGGWGLTLQLQLQFRPWQGEGVPRTDSHIVSGHRYLTRKFAKCTIHTFTTAVQADQPCSRTPPPLPIYEEDDWTYKDASRYLEGIAYYHIHL